MRESPDLTPDDEITKVVRVAGTGNRDGDPDGQGWWLGLGGLRESGLTS